MAEVNNVNSAQVGQLQRDAQAAFALGATEGDTWEFVKNALASDSYGGLNTTVKNMIIQEEMQKRAERSTFLSNLLKTLHEASMTIIRNLRLG